MTAKPKDPAEQESKSDAKADAKPQMTAEQAAKRVKRVNVVEDKGASREVTTPIKASEVLAFKDYGSHVVVVTKDGQKFSDAPAAEAVEA